MATVRVGQIGLGHWGTLHCKALTRAHGVKLVGIYDIDYNKAENIAQLYEVKAFSNLDSLLDVVEAVVVAVPARQHFKIAHRALSRDVSVFVEKPITAAVSEAETLVRLALEKDLILQVGHIERFNPAVRALKQEDIRPKYIEATRMTRFQGRGGDVSVVLDLMIHDLDLALYFAKSEVAEIRAHGAAVITQELDFAHAMIRFENGCLAALSASRAAFQNLRQMYIHQNSAVYHIDFLERKSKKMALERTTKTQSAPNFTNDPNLESELQCLASDDHEALSEQLRAFIYSVGRGVNPVVDGTQGKQVLELATEIARQIDRAKKP
ncbi:Gfo/Idh/MocA family oxidoreductase [bacterium]|nr:Gfo/Idh/MocA family oxidoreductase [bacterium]